MPPLCDVFHKKVYRCTVVYTFPPWERCNVVWSSYFDDIALEKGLFLYTCVHLYTFGILEGAGRGVLLRIDVGYWCFHVLLSLIIVRVEAFCDVLHKKVCFVLGSTLGSALSV